MESIDWRGLKLPGLVEIVRINENIFNDIIFVSNDQELDEYEKTTIKHYNEIFLFLPMNMYLYNR